MAGGLYQRLWYLTERQISHANLRLTNDGRRTLEDFIHRGVYNITSPNDMQMAERNLAFFVNNSIELAIISGLRFLDASIIERVKRALCPLHPFC